MIFMSNCEMRLFAGIAALCPAAFPANQVDHLVCLLDGFQASTRADYHSWAGFQANVQYGAGDVLNLATAVSVSGSNFTGAGAQIYIISQGAGLLGASGVSTGQGIGGILAYETGGDTYFFINSDDESENYAFVVEGKDLITTTRIQILTSLPVRRQT